MLAIDSFVSYMDRFHTEDSIVKTNALSVFGAGGMAITYSARDNVVAQRSKKCATII